MIPLRDNIPHYRKPVVTWVILLLNIAVFMYELSLGGHLREFLYVHGFVPKRLFLAVPLSHKILPLFTSMFLHAGFLHLLGNCLYLWIFADNVEDRLGHGRFIVFYLFCGLFASLFHFMFNRGGTIPAIGASGAIAGVLGAYFISYPRARVLTILPFFFFWPVIEIPAFFFLGFWFLYQFILGISSLGFYGSGGIAFWAHIGGFIGGIVFLNLFGRNKYARRRSYRW